MKHKLIKKNVAVGETIELPTDTKVIHVVRMQEDSFWLFLLAPMEVND